MTMRAVPVGIIAIVLGSECGKERERSSDARAHFELRPELLLVTGKRKVLILGSLLKTCVKYVTFRICFPICECE